MGSKTLLQQFPYYLVMKVSLKKYLSQNLLKYSGTDMRDFQFTEVIFSQKITNNLSAFAVTVFRA